MSDHEEGHNKEDLEGFGRRDTEFVYERGVGLTIYAHKAAPWLSWEETQALAMWLTLMVSRRP